MTSDHQSNLRKLAQTCVQFGVNIQPGQELLITAPIAARDLVRMITEEAYKAGAVGVIPLFSDDGATLARYEHGSDAALEHASGWLFEAMGAALSSGKTARLAISGDTPGLLAHIDPAKVAKSNKAQAAAYRPFLDAIVGNNTNWNIIPFVTPGWAAKVFPDDPADIAQSKLWELIFKATRIDQPNPVASWQKNFDELKRREGILNDHAFSALHFEGGGTDLTVGLAKGHKWVGGGQTLPNGTEYAPNLPTEEVFTMPDRNRTEGRAVFTKPVSVAGSIVEGLVVEFTGGKATKVTADVGQDVIAKYFATDDGASHLGEVALVAKSSPIAETGTLFFNTLFDENAACHIAFGNAYAMNLREGFAAEDAVMNTSQIHMDCMIGHAGIHVTGIGSDGQRVPIMVDGEFVI